MKPVHEKYWEEVGKIFLDDPAQLEHTKRVFAYVQRIAKEIALPEEKRKVAEIAAIFHDVGIKEAERKYGSREGKYQHLEGPPVAWKILEAAQEEASVIARVVFIVGHHHDFSAIDGDDFQVLVEADVLANVLEGNITKAMLADLTDRVFVTGAGKRMAQEILTGEKPLL